MKRLVLFSVTVALAIAACAGTLEVRPAAAATEYPNRSVRLIVPFPPGGGADFMGRIVAQALTESRGYTVVVDNRGGANGAIGSEVVAKAKPDGYTLVLANNTTHVMVTVLGESKAYHPLRDFTPVSLVTGAPQLVVCLTTSPVRSVRELVELAKAKPGVVSYASGGNSSQTHLSAELFRLNTGVRLKHIPYKGTGPGFTALMAGEVEFMFVSMPATMPHLQSGRMRALAITGAKRSAQLPDVPTLAESGVAGFEINPWFGVLGPAGLPDPVLRKLHDDLVAAVRTNAVRERLTSQGAEAVGSSPEEFAATIRQELTQWGKIVKELGIIRGE